MIGPSKSYVAILYDCIQNEKTDVIKRFPFSPSNAGGCTRELSYKMMDYLGTLVLPTKPKDPKTQMLLDLGNSVEYHCVKWFKKAASVFISKYKQQTVDICEMEYNGKVYRVEGSSDDCFWSEKHKALIDYKSKGMKYSSYRDSDWTEMADKLSRIAQKIDDYGYWVEDLEIFLDKLGDPHFVSNFLQLNSYANTEFFMKRGIDHASVIQYAKNDSRMREIRFKPCPRVMEKVKAKFATALKAGIDGNPDSAPRDFNLGSMKCAFCEFASVCRPNKDVLKEWFKTLPEKEWAKDTNRLSKDVYNDLEALFAERAQVVDSVDALDSLDQDIIKVMENAGVYKIKLDNKDIYELKYLKSPKEHYEVRRSKV